MSRADRPKQLLPLINGRSLLQLAWERLEGLVPVERRYICAGQRHRDAILEQLPGLTEARYLAEPTGRDTLNAVGYGAAVIGRDDPDATIAVLTADHLIKPIDTFQQRLTAGYDLAERDDLPTLVTFGIKPTYAATGFGYLKLGDALDATTGAHVVDRFQEKPQQDVAQQYLDAGPERYLWNSGMFVWRASSLLGCIERYESDVHRDLMRIAAAWTTPERDATLESVYPTLKKISIDYAVMEPASKDDAVRVAAVPMDLTWLDVGSWPALAETREKDAHGNASTTPCTELIDTRNTLIASSAPNHLITTVGCDDLIIIHTPEATLVCKADQAERIKTLHEQVKAQHGEEYL